MRQPILPPGARKKRNLGNSKSPPAIKSLGLEKTTKTISVLDQNSIHIFPAMPPQVEHCCPCTSAQSSASRDPPPMVSFPRPHPSQRGMGSDEDGWPSVGLQLNECNTDFREPHEQLCSAKRKDKRKWPFRKKAIICLWESDQLENKLSVTFWHALPFLANFFFHIKKYFCSARKRASEADYDWRQSLLFPNSSLNHIKFKSTSS